jgi:hypothetical protein
MLVLPWSASYDCSQILCPYRLDSQKFMAHQLYLSRRNILALLSKLDRAAAGEATACTIIKYDNTHKRYPQTMPSIEVVAVEVTDYFSPQPAKVHISRRSLSDLTAKLDRKNSDTPAQIRLESSHPQERDREILTVVALEDAQYYVDRPAGQMWHADEAVLQKCGAVPPTGITPKFGMPHQ